MKKILLLAVSAVVALALAAPVSAATVVFDPTGGSGAGGIVIDRFDPLPGNSITLGVTGLSLPIITQSTVLFQANLGVATAGGGIVYTNCVGGSCFTFVAGLPVVLTSNIPVPTIPPQQALTFDFGSGATNFFHIYATAAPGSDTSGLGFTSGTLVMSGVFVNDPLFGATFIASPTVIGDLDQFNGAGDPPGGDNYPLIDTVAGTGSFQAHIQVSFAHDAYFPGLVDGSVVLFGASAESVPYGNVNPSNCFYPTGAGGNAGCTQPGAQLVSVGPLNGITGPNTMLETDARFAFEAAEVIPEPATLTLLGLGLLGSAAMRRRQLKKNRQ